MMALGYSLAALDGLMPVSVESVFSDCAGAGLMPLRHSRKQGKAASARRTFSSQDKWRRARCHSACRAKSCCGSLIQEARLEPLPGGGQAVLFYQVFHSLASRAATFQQGQDARKILPPSDAQGNRRQMARADDADGRAFKTSFLRLTQRLRSQRTEHGDELHRPSTDAKALARSAVDTALADAGLDAWAIESVFFANASQGHMERQHMIRGQIAMRSMGISGIQVVNVETHARVAAARYSSRSPR